jgi:hypothetical protein
VHPFQKPFHRMTSGVVSAVLALTLAAGSSAAWAGPHGGGPPAASPDMGGAAHGPVGSAATLGAQNSNGSLSMERDMGRGRAEDRVNARFNANKNGHAAPDRDLRANRAEDRSTMHMRGENHMRASAISNGRYSVDRDHGRDRATDRSRRRHHHRG